MIVWRLSGICNIWYETQIQVPYFFLKFRCTCCVFMEDEGFVPFQRFHCYMCNNLRWDNFDLVQENNSTDMENVTWQYMILKTLKMLSWLANRMEPDQTAWMYRLSWIPAGGQSLSTSCPSGVRVNSVYCGPAVSLSRNLIIFLRILLFGFGFLTDIQVGNLFLFTAPVYYSCFSTVYTAVTTYFRTLWFASLVVCYVWIENLEIQYWNRH